MIDTIESALVGPIFTEQASALEFAENLDLEGFEPFSIQSFACREIWVKTLEWHKEGSFTREKLLSHCFQSPSFGPSPVERSATVAEISRSGSSIGMKQHAEILMDRHTREKIKGAMECLADGPSEEQIEALETKLAELRSSKMMARNDEKEQACMELLEELDSMAKGNLSLPSSNVQIWDSVIGGLPPAQLIVLAGRPGGGKTSLSEQVIDATVRLQTPVLYIQRELSRTRAIGRLASRCCDVPWSRVEMRKLRPEEISKLQRSVGEYKKLPLYLAPVTVCNSSTISSLIRYHSRVNKIKLVVMDYVQLINVPRGQDRRVAIGDVTRSLKLAANETGVTVIAIAQLSREVERTESKPNLSHLKESGDIEQDADVVLGLWCSQDRDEQARWPINWSILKNRNGAVGTVEVMFDGPSMSFLGRQTYP